MSKTISSVQINPDAKKQVSSGHEPSERLRAPSPLSASPAELLIARAASPALSATQAADLLAGLAARPDDPALPAVLGALASNRRALRMVRDPASGLFPQVVELRTRLWLELDRQGWMGWSVPYAPDSPIGAMSAGLSHLTALLGWPSQPVG